MDTEDELPPSFVPLWALLRGHGHLWHRTTLPALEGIFREKAILPNRGEFPNTFCQSKVSYSRHLKAVSLFDFDTATEQRISEHRRKWMDVLVANMPRVDILIRIAREALDRNRLVLPDEVSGDDVRLNALCEKVRKMRMYLPGVEALHIGPIGVETFTGFILLSGEGQEYHCHEAAFNGEHEAIRAMSTTATEWTNDYERRTAERHARGEYTLAERLDQAIKKQEQNS
jgi:hypothetical protein